MYHFNKRKGVWVSRDDNLWGSRYGKLIEGKASMQLVLFMQTHRGDDFLSPVIRFAL